MSERVTKATVEARVENVNRRLAGTNRRVYAQDRNDYTALDLVRRNPQEDAADIAVTTLMAGTKREVAEFLHAMMVGIDLSRGETVL